MTHQKWFYFIVKKFFLADSKVGDIKHNNKYC